MASAVSKRPGRRGAREQVLLFDANGAVVKKPRKRRRGVKLGRPAQAERVGFVAHAPREAHDFRHPVHVSIKCVKLHTSLRTERVYAAIVRQLARLKSGGQSGEKSADKNADKNGKGRGVRVVHYDVQADHIHLIVEGENRDDLSRKMQRLFSRIALAVNAVLGRRGSLFRDRHHRRELRSPTQTRNALVYVLFNARRHAFSNGGKISERTLGELDERSSIGWVTEWREDARPPPELVARLRARSTDPETGETPVSLPTTWLARTGWFQRGGGRMVVHEVPRFR